MTIGFINYIERERMCDQNNYLLILISEMIFKVSSVYW